MKNFIQECLYRSQDFNSTYQIQVTSIIPWATCPVSFYCCTACKVGSDFSLILCFKSLPHVFFCKSFICITYVKHLQNKGFCSSGWDASSLGNWFSTF